MSTAVLTCVAMPIAAADWLDAVLPILFAVVWVVSQVVAAARRLGGGQRAEGPVRRPAAGPRPAVPVARNAPADGAAMRAELERQIEAFRRAQAEGAAGQATRKAPPAPRPKPPPSVAAKPPAAAPAKPRPEARPAVRAPVLGGHAGDLARHVEGAFAHDLAHASSPLQERLGGSTAPRAETPQARSPAELLVAMIRDPAMVRQAFLLREVLDRPVERW